MKLNLKEVTFSYRGSYMAISYLEDGSRHKQAEKGLYLRNVHGAAETSLVARILVRGKEDPVEYQYEACPEVLTIKDGEKECQIVFADADTLWIRGNLELTLDFMSNNVPFTFIQPTKAGKRDFYLVNCFMTNCRYMMHADKGALIPDQEWKVSTADGCRMHLVPDASGEYLISLEENLYDWSDRGRKIEFEKAVQESKEAFEKFYASMPEVPDCYRDAAEMASYVDWSSIVKPCGLIKREAMFMSKNWMCNVWSWDHCFNALALAYNNPKEAWDQFMIMFYYQKPSGNIPDSVNDCKQVDNYCKPPIHGWALRKMTEIMDVSMEQLQEAYEKISKWTNWWLKCRDANEDGLCEYTHGNDSGWDNATAFRELPPATLPDLAGFLILQMDVLSETAEKLHKKADADMWKQRADRMLEQMLGELYVDGLPAAFTGLEKHRVETDSLILYLPIVLGKRLPKEIRRNMVEVLESDKFNTAYGLATESPKSSLYDPDGYWRGPIWAPSTMLILDGLRECGEEEFVREVTHKFCQMVGKSGCAENFDALTGEGLRDRAYTWTASAMLVMANQYL